MAIHRRWIHRLRTRKATRPDHRRRRSVGHRATRCLEQLEPRIVLTGDLLIAEVMVLNDQTLRDEDGIFSDWLEIYNSGPSAVDLTGWHLTDRINDRTMWTFEGGSLDSGESLIVFASEKDRRTVGEELHTNFRLSEGEYLGLYEPDGRTVSDEYVSLTAQYTDVSYGVEQRLVAESLVSEGDTVRVLLPASGAEDIPPAVWTSPTFDDASWVRMNTGLGYDVDPTDGDFGPLIHPNGSLAAMRGQTASAYVRSTFEITGERLPLFESMDLEINYDDGFIAYLNGQEIARVNAPDNPAWDSVATASHGGIAADIDYPDFADADDRDDYTLLGSSAWQGERLQLTPAQTEQTGAAWLTNPVAFGPDFTFSASMTFDIHSPGPGGVFPDSDGLGGEGMTFVLQANSNNVLGQGGGGLGIDGTGSAFLAIELDSVATGSFDPDDALPSHLGIETSEAGNLARVALPRFNGNALFPGQPGPGVNLLYLWMDYSGEQQQLDVYFNTTDEKPETPTLTTSVNLQEVFSDTTSLWAGWTASTSAAYNAHDVLKWNLVTGVGEIARDPVSLDVSSHVDALRLGTNVLAIHGLNVDPGDEDFLLIPRLSAESVTLGERLYFPDPTPGRLNGEGQLAPSGPVSFSVTNPIFVDPFSVEIAAESPLATIHYTTDGTLPDASSPVYDGPISVNDSMRIRARAIEPDRGPGPVTTVGYTQLDASLSNFENGEVFSSNLPLIVFDSFQRSSADSQSQRLVPGVATFIAPGEDGRASLLDQPEYTGRVGMRIRGQSSQGWPKKQYAVEIWEEGNDDSRPLYAYQAEDKSVSIFGLPAESDWVLNGPYSDKTQLNNYLTFLWSNKIGLYAPRARLVEVFVNNATSSSNSLNYRTDYRGTYVLLEKIKIDDNRVDLVELEPGDTTEPEITGGYIWKKDKDPEVASTERPFSTKYNDAQRLVDPSDPPIPSLAGEPGYATAEQRQWLIDYIEEFEAVLHGPNFADPKEGYAKYIDVDSWVDTWLLVEFTKNIDGFRLSTYYHKDRGGKIKQGPAWDYNLSFANGNYLQGAYPEGWYHTGISSLQYPYWTRLFQDPNFEQRVADRWQELRQSLWSTENLLADIDAAVALLSDGNPNLERPAPGEPSNPISRNFDRWGTLTSYLWPNCFFGDGACPPSPLPSSLSPNGRPNSYDDYIYIMKWFVEERAEWIDSQFVPAVSVLPAGGIVPKPTEVTISGPAQYELYYTLDGTDPRQPLIIEEERTVLETGAPVQIYVPTDGTLMGHCDDGYSLDNRLACFVNPDYTLGFNGETWVTGTTPIGFDADGDYDPLIATDIGEQMSGVNSTVYARIPFEVSDELLSDGTALDLRVRYDDGFVAYLWLSSFGIPVEIARANAPGSVRPFPINALEYDAAATRTNPDEQAVEYQTFDISRAIRWIREGQNYLVFQSLNESAGSSDFLLDVEMVLRTERVEVSPSVRRYSGPFVIDANTQVQARGFDPETDGWTGRRRVTYVVDAPQIAMTEINYNPHDPTSAELTVNPDLESDDFEFLEIRNVGPTAVNLVDARFTVGLDFTFPNVELAPGDYGVIVKDANAFALRYGSDVNVIGEFFGGGLDNGGERLQVQDAAGQVVLDFRYDDNAIWPQRADGDGSSLQLIDPAFAAPETYSKYYQWRASTELGGSPGRAGADPIGVVINEVLSRPAEGTQQTDAVELLNVTDAPIDVSGWYLSDSANNLQKYQIAPGTILAPGQYLVLDESHFNADPNDDRSFALSGTGGDDLWLTILDSLGQVTAFVDDVQFGPSLSGESFGRVPNGDGRLTPMAELTLGADNETPRVGPVVISEVQYNPDEPTAADREIDPGITSGDLEFIEIHNPTEQLVQLEEWRVRGGVDYNFYPDETLAAGETILLVGFDPEDAQSANRLAAFRQHYGLSEDVRILGGHGQQLAGGGERIALLRPDLSQIGEPRELPRVQEDEVVYDDREPWPTQADGTGKSLQRRSATSFGNAANSWTAADPTPGRVDFQASPGDFDGDGTVDATDINLLFQQMRAPDPDLRYDLTGDGLVDAKDRDEMIFEVLGTSYGDSNLDGRFGTGDLVRVLQAGKYRHPTPGTATWDEGDWNGDGNFDEADLMLAYQTGSYEATPDSPAEPNQILVAAALQADQTAFSRPVHAPQTSEKIPSPPVTVRARDLALLEMSSAQTRTSDDSLIEFTATVEDDLLDEQLLDELATSLLD